MGILSKIKHIWRRTLSQQLVENNGFFYLWIIIFDKISEENFKRRVYTILRMGWIWNVKKYRVITYLISVSNTIQTSGCLDS